MRRNQAAEYLGVSAKTLYRLERAGKLTSRKEKTSTGHVIEYEIAELDRLKEELSQQREVPKAPKPTRLRRVTFGLPATDFEELEREATRYGLKPGEYARKLMRDSFESQLRADLGDLHAQDKKIKGEVKRLRSEVASAFEVLLEYLNFPPQEAKTWVTENLR